MVNNLTLVTVATHRTHELDRFIESAEYFGYEYVILGLGKQWVGGEANNGRLVFPGGGMKVNLFKEYLQTVDNDEDVILFTDSYDVVFNQGPDELLSRWSNMGEGLLFTAEKTCWPDPKLERVYPETIFDYRFLNSGGFIGRAGDLKVLTQTRCEDSDDDQLYYTLKFLNSEGISLDYDVEIFQTLNSSFDDVEVIEGVVYNKVTETYPVVVHANGGVGPRTYLNKLYNDMNRPEKELRVLRGDERVMMQVFFDFEHSNPRIILDSIEYLTYPKKLIDVVIYNTEKTNDWAITKFIKDNKEKYRTIDYVYEIGESTYDLRDHAMRNSLIHECDFLLQIDGSYNVKNRDTIQLLMEENQDIISPMINTEGTLNSNFWGGVSPDGYFAESDNYFPIRNYENVGTFVVPFISGVIMYTNGILKNKIFDSLYGRHRDDDYYGDDYFVVFCNVMRESNLFTYVTNKRYFGKTFN